MRYTLNLIMQEVDWLKEEEQAIQDKLNRFDFETVTEYNFFTEKLQEIKVIIEILQTDIILIYNFHSEKQFTHHLKKWKDESQN